MEVEAFDWVAQHQHDDADMEVDEEGGKCGGVEGEGGSCHKYTCHSHQASYMQECLSRAPQQLGGGLHYQLTPHIASVGASPYTAWKAVIIGFHK